MLAARIGMRLLFVKLKHIGDTLLLTPTLSAVRTAYPSAEIWVAVRRGCEGILAGCPAVDQVVLAAPPEANKRSPLSWVDDLHVIGELRRQEFDHAFELTDGDRGRLLVWLSGAKQRYANEGIRPLSGFWRGRFDRLAHCDWRGRHRVEADYLFVREMLTLPETAPALVFTRDRTQPWNAGRPLENYVVIHAGTRWVRKRWTIDRWVEVGQFLISNSFQVVMSCGPDPEEVAQADAVVNKLGAQAVSTGGMTNWSQLAGLLYGARLFVGVDTAAMHLAAACQCPTVALFGPSVVEQWHPWRVPYRIVHPPEESKKLPLEERFVETTETAAVIRACQEMLRVS